MNFGMIEKVKKKKCIYDCIVPWSGGKDSSAIAYKLKFQFGLNPLLVHSLNDTTDVGLHNVKMLKLDLITFFSS